MVRKFVSATVSAALCLSLVAPTIAMAQEYRFTGFDAPRGASATINLRVPMGREHADRASYGLTLGYGQAVGVPGVSGDTQTRSVNLADLRFRGGELRTAQVASFDLANLDEDRRLNMAGDNRAVWWVVGAIVVAAAICVVAFECFEDDDDDDI